mgnify:CR=1 FL=1
MERFEDKRINEALELLNTVARDKKAELQAALENKYTDLSSVVSAFTDQMKNRATEPGITPHRVDGDSHGRRPAQSSDPSVTCRPL